MARDGEQLRPDLVRGDFNALREAASAASEAPFRAPGGAPPPGRSAWANERIERRDFLRLWRSLAALQERGKAAGIARRLEDAAGRSLSADEAQMCVCVCVHVTGVRRSKLPGRVWFRVWVCT